MSNPNLQALSDAGVSIWLDDLSRGRLTSGNLAALIKDSNVVGVTTNPSIFHAAITTGEGYNDDLAEETRKGAGSPSRSTRASPTTPRPPSPRPRSCMPASTEPTS